MSTNLDLPVEVHSYRQVANFRIETCSKLHDTSEYVVVQCGGTLVHDNIELSAAHCFEDSVTESIIDIQLFVIATNRTKVNLNDANEGIYFQQRQGL